MIMPAFHLHSIQAYFALLRRRYDLLLLNFIFILVVISLAMWLALGGPKPQTEPVTQYKLPSAEKLNEKVLVEYYGEKTLPFTELPMYQTTNVSKPEDLIAKTIATYGLAQSSYSKFIYRSGDGKISLNTANNNAYFEFTFLQNAPTSGNQVTDEVAIEKATTFLKDFGFDTSQYELNESNLEYFNIPQNGNEYVSQKSMEGANVIRLSYERKLEKLPVVISSQNLTGVQLEITQSGVYKVKMNPYQYTPQKNGAATLISIDQALANIINGDYSFLTSILRAKTTGSNRVATLILRDFQIVYRLNLEDYQILPYYDFSGEAELANGELSPVRITTPAIPSDLIENTPAESTGHRE